MSVRRQAEEALGSIASGLASAVGEEFFDRVAQLLSRITGMEFVLIGELAGEREDKVRIISIWAKDRLSDPFEYDLDGTPCERVMGQNLCIFPDAVQQKFPKDAILTNIKAQSYIGAPLFNRHGKALGIIALLDGKPLTDPKTAENCLKICADRAAVEMERLQAEKALKQSEQRYRLLVEGVKLIAWEYDLRTKRFTFISGKARQITGYDEEEWYGEDFWENHIYPDEREEVVEYCARFTRNLRDHEFEYRMITKSGSTIWVRNIVHVIAENNRPVKLRGVFVDVTDRKQAEEANRLKDKYVSTVTHEVRAPLALTCGLLRFMEKDADKLDEKTHDELLARAINNCERLLDMSDKLVEICNLQTGRLKPQPRFINAGGIVAMIAESVSGQADEKGITIVNNIPPVTRVFADQFLLGEVVRNLLSNAIKYTSAGGVVTIFSPDGQPGSIAVKDSGAGMNDKEIGELFKPDFNAPAPGTKGERGIGLGLLFCKNIMEAHAGSLVVESQPGKGSVFYANLPDRRPVIMVADHNNKQRRALIKTLEPVGADILPANDGESAMEILERVTPDLVIVELHMPVISGLDILESIRKNRNTSSVFVIVMSGSGKIEDREKVFEQGADDFISKPALEEEVLRRAGRFICF